MLTRSLALALAMLLAPAQAALADGRPLHRRGAPPPAPHSARHGPTVRYVRTVGHRHVHRHGHCRYVAGHHESRVRRIVVPGHHVERVIAAEYAVTWDACVRAYVRVEVRPRRVVRTWVPRRVRLRRERVWVPARWFCP